MPDADYRSQRCRTEFFAVYYYLHSRLLRRELHAASRRQLHRQRRLLALLHGKLLLEVGTARFLQHERMAANEQSLHNVWRDAILLAVNPNLGVHRVAVDRGRAIDGLRCELDCLRPTGNDFQLTARVAVARHRHHDVAQSLALTPRQRSAALAVASTVTTAPCGACTVISAKRAASVTATLAVCPSATLTLRRSTAYCGA